MPEKARQKTLAQRLGRVLERVTRQSGRPDTPAYGSLLLGRVSESQHRRRVRIQVILTILVVVANLIGIAVAILLVTVAIPEPSVFDDAPFWITVAAVPAYIAFALAIGAIGLPGGPWSPCAGRSRNANRLVTTSATPSWPRGASHSSFLSCGDSGRCC